MDTSQTSLAVNPEHEADFLREKLEHFKLVIHKLQEELQTQKVRKEGAETVSRLLQESKHEAVALRRKVRTYESVIRNLQSRLESHGMSSEITLQEGEQYLPGHSQQMLDNLTRENKRLRNIIRNENGDPEELVRLQKQFQDLKNELEETKGLIGKHQARETELEGLLRASDNDKDVTIATLRQELERVNQDLNARKSQCMTLEEESQNLQSQLKGVAEQCQDLARRLQEKGTASAPSPEVKHPESKKATLEGDVLARKLKEITEMNMRWQAYDKQREGHVRKLTQELAELRERAGVGSIARDVEVEMNRVLDKAREDVARVSSELVKAKRELEIANKDRTAMRTEINRLRQRLDSAAAGSDAAETIQALKAQIQICTEDFESERKDREKAQARLAKQEAEMDQLRRENEALKRSQLQLAPAPAGEYNDPFFHYHGFGNEGLAARGSSAKRNTKERRHIDKYNVIDGAQVQSDGQEDVSRMHRGANDIVRERFLSEQTAKEDLNDKNTDEKYQSLRTSSLSSSGRDLSPPPPSDTQRENSTSSPIDVTSSTERRDDEGKKPGELLKCPKCDNTFTSNEHFDLLEHIEMCCE